MEGSDNDLLVITISKSDLFDMVTAVIMRIERFISMQAPQVMIDRAIDRVDKYNRVLEQSGYNHWTEKINQLKEKAHYESIQ